MRATVHTQPLGRLSIWARVLLHVVLPTALGAAIYVLWRSPRLIVFRWLGIIHFTGVTHVLRHALAPAKPSLPGFVLYSLPDALWVYAFTAALALVWSDVAAGWQRRMWLLLPAALGIGSEFGQALHVVPGTFDWSDVAAYAVAGVLGVWLPCVKFRGSVCWKVSRNSATTNSPIGELCDVSK